MALTNEDLFAISQLLDVKLDSKLKSELQPLKDGIRDCEAIVWIFVGEKENNSIKKSAKLIHEKLQGSFIQVLPNMYHGEFSINHADDYVRRLLEIIEQK